MRTAICVSECNRACRAEVTVRAAMRRTSKVRKMVPDVNEMAWNHSECCFVGGEFMFHRKLFDAYLASELAGK